MQQQQQQQQAVFFEVYRSSLRAAADMMKTSLENAERMQNQQLEGARLAVDHWTRLCASAAEMQMALIGQAQHQLGQMGERVREGYSLGARQVEDAARFSSSPAANQHERKERKSA